MPSRRPKGKKLDDVQLRAIALRAEARLEVRRQIEEIERKKKYQEQLIKERAWEQAKLRAQKDREERKLRAEKDRKERKIRAQKEREQLKLHEEEARKRYLRQEAAEERLRKRQKKAAESMMRTEAERVKQTGQEEICEYRLVESESSDWNAVNTILAKVCIDHKGNLSRAAAKGLHPITVSLLATWSLISIPPELPGRAVLEALRVSLEKCKPEAGYLINVSRDLEKKARKLPVGDYMDVLKTTQIVMMNTSIRSRGLREVHRIKQELLSSLNEMFGAFGKPVLPALLIS